MHKLPCTNSLIQHEAFKLPLHPCLVNVKNNFPSVMHTILVSWVEGSRAACRIFNLILSAKLTLFFSPVLVCNHLPSSCIGRGQLFLYPMPSQPSWPSLMPSQFFSTLNLYVSIFHSLNIVQWTFFLNLFYSFSHLYLHFISLDISGQLIDNCTYHTNSTYH